MTLSPPLFPLTLGLYAVACTLYYVHLAVSLSRESKFSRPADIVLLLGFVSHGVDITWLCLHGLHPGVNVREALSFVAWLTAGAYLVVTRRAQLPTVGLLVVPVVLVLEVAARFAPGQETRRGLSPVGTLHIVLSSAGVALLSIAAGGAAVYLIVERRLKQKQATRLGRRGIALETLDTINQRLVLAGFPMFTLALVAGVIWMAELHSSVDRMAPQLALSVLTWMLYAGLLVARRAAGWRGGRAAKLTLVGFALLLTVLMTYFIHGVFGS